MTVGSGEALNNSDGRAGAGRLESAPLWSETRSVRVVQGFPSAMLLASALAVADATAHASAGDTPALVEIAAEAGIDHVYGGPWEYFVGGGAASFDCNGDRRPDLVLAGGERPTGLYVNQIATPGTIRFEARPNAIPERTRHQVTGAYPINIDNDGWTDVVLLRVGRNFLLRGGPNCTFEIANKLWNFEGGRAWSTAFAAIWERGARHPTLAFGNYVDRARPGSPWGTCHENVLLRPGGAETPDYREPTLLAPGHCALSMLFTDWNNSAEAALRITNDRQYHLDGEDQLWRMGTGAAPTPYRRADGWQRLRIWGMGIAEADIDADGYPEYVLTSMGDTKLQRLERDAEEERPVYTDVAFDLGATAHRPYAGDDRRPSTGWHAEFADFNNDSLLDLYIAKGNVEAMPDFAHNDPDNLLLGTWQGGFAEAGDRAGIALDRRGRGAAIADFDLDGALDLLVVNREAPTSLFRNAGVETEWGFAPLGNWIGIELRQQGANTSAVGARLAIRIGNRTVSRTVQIGGGHGSGRVGWVHVGLGIAERALIRVRWPDGEWGHGYQAFANNFVILERGAAAVRYWYPE